MGFQVLAWRAPARTSSTFSPMFVSANALRLCWGIRAGGEGFGLCCFQRKALLLTGKRDFFFFFCLALNNWGRVGYYLIRNSSLHLLRTIGWHSWKIKWNYNVCKIADNVTFASGLAWAFICSLQLSCHCCLRGSVTEHTCNSNTRISWRISKRVLNDGLAGVFKVAVGIWNPWCCSGSYQDSWKNSLSPSYKIL